MWIHCSPFRLWAIYSMSLIQSQMGFFPRGWSLTQEGREWLPSGLGFALHSLGLDPTYGVQSIPHQAWSQWSSPISIYSWRNQTSGRLGISLLKVLFAEKNNSNVKPSQHGRGWHLSFTETRPWDKDTKPSMLHDIVREAFWNQYSEIWLSNYFSCTRWENQHKLTFMNPLFKMTCRT